MNFIDNKVNIADTAVVLNSTLKMYTRIKAYAEVKDSILGEYSYISQQSIINKTNIGKFCSISSGCYVGLWEHNTQVSTHSFYLYEHSGEFVKGYRNYDKDYMETNIANDVWIGANALVLKGVNIGNGAIIGGGAVVTKDVPDYAVVVGNPAKILKFRYSKEDIEFMLRVKWWNFDRQKLQKLIDQNAFDSFDKFKKIIVANRWGGILIIYKTSMLQGLHRCFVDYVEQIKDRELGLNMFLAVHKNINFMSAKNVV